MLALGQLTGKTAIEKWNMCAKEVQIMVALPVFQRNRLDDRMLAEKFVCPLHKKQAVGHHRQ